MYPDIEESEEIVCPNCNEVLEMEKDFKGVGYYIPLTCPSCGADLSDFIKKIQITGADKSEHAQS